MWEDPECGGDTYYENENAFGRILLLIRRGVSEGGGGGIVPESLNGRGGI